MTSASAMVRRTPFCERLFAAIVSRGLPAISSRKGFADIMNTRLIALAAMAGLVSGCTTTGPASNPIETRWNGKSAGSFFARYAPPYSDSRTGSETVYNWRGGFNRIKTKDGRTMSVSCSAQIVTGEDYRIRSIRVTADRSGAKGPSYCEELLTAE